MKRAVRYFSALYCTGIGGAILLSTYMLLKHDPTHYHPMLGPVVSPAMGVAFVWAGGYFFRRSVEAGI